MSLNPPKTELSDSRFLELYRKLLVARESEEAIRADYFSNEMKTPVHLGIGCEAIAVGVSGALDNAAGYFATYRNHAIYLSLSNDTDGFFGEMYGRVTGSGKGKAGSMHLACPEYGLIATSAVVGTTIPLAVGAAFAKKFKNENGIIVTFLGDGAVEEGVFWESLNFATLHQLPVLFVCEDNELAIHTFKKERQGFKSLDKIVEQFEMPTGCGDGWDLETVFSETSRVVQTMKTSGGPGFLHFNYFRFLEHVGPNEDFAAGYRSKPDFARENYDPVLISEKALLERGVPKETLTAMRSDVLEQIKKSVERAKLAPFPTDEELFLDVYAESFASLNDSEKEKQFPGSFYSNGKHSVKLRDFRPTDNQGMRN